MPRQRRDLPGREVAEDLRGAQAQLVAQRMQLGVDVDRRAGAGLAQVLDLRLEVGDGLFEVEIVRVHLQRTLWQPGCRGSQQSSRPTPAIQIGRGAWRGKGCP